MPIALTPAMKSFREQPATDAALMERVFEVRAGMPVDVTRHDAPQPL